MSSKEIKAVITVKNDRGEYKIIKKKFNDDKHLENYMVLIDGKGKKVIGHEIL